MKLYTEYYNEYIVSEYYNIKLVMNSNGNKIDNMKLVVDEFFVISSRKLLNHFCVFWALESLLVW